MIANSPREALGQREGPLSYSYLLDTLITSRPKYGTEITRYDWYMQSAPVAGCLRDVARVLRGKRCRAAAEGKPEAFKVIIFQKMFTTRRAIDKILLGYKNEFRRQISKTTSVTNSDAMAPRLDQSTQNEEKPTTGIPKLLKLKKYHRFLSTLNSQQLPLAARGLSVSKDQSREFMACFPDIVRDLTESRKHIDVPEASRWLAKVLQYNVPNGKKNRGLATVLAYKMLEKNENMTPENIHLANVMGWCVEMFHTQQLMLNDLIEGTEMRRAAPSWHRRPEVGLTAANDTKLLEAAMFSTLKRNFQFKPYYKNVLEMFNEMLLKCSIGQYLDKSLSKTDKPNLEQFTMDKYIAICKYMTAYYTFQMPVSLALLMAGVDDPETHRQAKTILLEMGQFFQIQDDFLDCFGDPSVTGKVGTDIQDGKCTWLAVVALQRATPAQREIMENHYGSSNPEDVTKIKNLYEDLQLPHTYSVYEEATYDLIRTQIQQVTRGLPHDLFFKILDTIFRTNV
ncbi:Farnesyl pyrophosphate synthase [Eumeta japonica]|uniref:Farnesyl pyrophosphate synthase n=1 Tax=Eumeta variegata TaxID=151549 RepID=A0A4C1XPS1_EUMVA|nr:Farnesyl pyrophosphate synthase [Eumeta japonica]